MLLEKTASSPRPQVPQAHSSGQDLYIEIPQRQLSVFCGVNDRNLRLMSGLFGSRVQCRGNQLRLGSPCPELQKLFGLFVRKVLLYMSKGIEVRADLLDALLFDSRAQLGQLPSSSGAGVPSASLQQDAFYDPRQSALTLSGKKILPRNRHQHELLCLLSSHDVVFVLGPAGTGKTFLVLAYGLSQLLSGKISLLLLSRPVVEAGESLGFLPGDFGQKISPYMLPLFDVMRYLIKEEQMCALEAKGMIEVAPLAYMRGRSLRDAIVILDEAQNATPQQVKMLLTRLGEGSQAILTGDPSQSDLGSVRQSGLYQASCLLAGVEGVAVQHFGNEDIVRSSLVRRIILAYDREERPEKEKRTPNSPSLSRKKGKQNSQREP